MNKYSKFICTIIIVLQIIASIIVINMNSKGIRNGEAIVSTSVNELNYTLGEKELKERASDFLYVMPFVSLVLLIISFIRYKKSKEEQKSIEKGGVFFYLTLFLISIIFVMFMIPFMIVVA